MQKKMNVGLMFTEENTANPKQGGTGFTLGRLGTQWEKETPEHPGCRADSMAAAGAPSGRAKPLGKSPVGTGVWGSC